MEKDPRPRECLGPRRQNGRRRANGAGNPGPSVHAMPSDLPDHRAKVKERASRASERGQAKVNNREPA